jgi:5'(3')-deoxyribonucleotidase
MIDPATVAFDIDGVIADTMTLFLDIARREHAVDWILYEDITCYDLEACLDLDRQIIDDVIRRLLDGHYSVELKPIPGAAETLARIGRCHNPVLMVTARPNLGPMAQWITELLAPARVRADIVATGSFEAKADVLLERNVACFVEDRLDTCFLLQRAGITPVLFKQPWNRQPHGFVEVGSWSELEALIHFS